MKKIILSSIFLVLSASGSDTKNSKINDALRYYELKGAVDTMRELNCSAVEKLGEIDVGQCENDTVFHFDKDGRELEVLTFDKNHNVVSRMKSKYNEAGFYTGSEFYTGYKSYLDADDENNRLELSYKSIATLSPENDMEKIEIYDAGNGKISRHFEHDDRGKRTSVRRFDKNNILETIIKYTYNQQNLKVTEKWYAKDEKLERALVFKYDDKGHLIEQTETNYKEKGNITKSTYKYIFDKNDNWTEKVEYQSNKPITIWEREIKYY